MAYNVKITYKKPVEILNDVKPIMPLFDSSKNYIGVTSYTEAQSNKIWSDKVVGSNDITSTRDAGAMSSKSVYATGVKGWGEIEKPIITESQQVPFPVSLAQFGMNTPPLATFDPTTQTYIAEFVVEDYKDAMYYADIGVAMGDNGFEVEIEKVTPTPPTPSEVVFDRYISINNPAMAVTIGNMLYIPMGDELSYFADAPKSEVVDPQPALLDNIPIDQSKGKVYNTTEIDTGIYLVKTDNVVLVYKRSTGIADMSFVYNDIEFKSSSETPVASEDVGIIGRDNGGAWTCADNSIIISGSSSEIYVGDQVSTPTV